MDLPTSVHSFVPVYSQEMTLEAHFTFTSPMASSKMVSGESLTNTVPSSVRKTPKVFDGKEDSWHWNKNGAECSVACNPRGLSMKYDTSRIPTCETITHSTRERINPLFSQAIPERPRKVSPKKESKHDYGGDAKRASSHPNLEGNLRGNRVHVARPYERRCKSTAQIVLQNNVETNKKRAREFHGSTPLESSTYRHNNTNERIKEFAHPHWDCQQVQHPLCSCPHCTTLHKLVTSLRHDMSCGCPYQYPSSTYQAPKNMVKFSPSSHTFNSHRSYDSLPTRRNRRKGSPVSKKGDRPDTPVPTSRSPSPEITPTLHQKQFISRDIFSTERNTTQERAAQRGKRSRKGRPRTIHIDVYCSSSSSSDESERSQSSGSTIEEDCPNATPSSSRPLVALGSKKSHYKNDFKLQSRSLGRTAGANKKCLPSDGSYQSTPAEEKYRPGAFITDHPLSLCSSPSTPLERPVSSPPQVNVDKYSNGARAKNYSSIPRNILDMPLPAPVKPNSLRISPHVLRDTQTQQPDSYLYGDEELINFNRNLIDLSSAPAEKERRLTSRSDSSLQSLHNAFSDLNTYDDDDYRDDDIFIRPWRSPKFERQKFLTKELEDRHEAAMQNRRADSSKIATSEVLKTPTEVSELAKMSVFKDFSQEELTVISKSLTRRESERSVTSRHSGSTLSRHSSFRLQKSPSLMSQNSGGSFKYRSEPNNDSPNRNLSEEAQNFLEELRRECVNGSFKADRNTLPKSNVDIRRSSQTEVNTVPSSISSQSTTPSTSPVKRKADVKQSSTGSRLVNPGIFRRLDKFPFSTYTYPGPYQSQPSVSLSDDDRMFVRPSLFGDVLKTNRRHGIHFGPPRNPQCSCVSCRVWRLNKASTRDLSPPRPRSHSMSDISPVSSSSSTASQSKRL